MEKTQRTTEKKAKCAPRACITCPNSMG